MKETRKTCGFSKVIFYVVLYLPGVSWHTFRANFREGKTRWLQPGKKYILGRTVENVPINDDEVYPSPRATITDLETTHGTFLDGKQIFGTTRLLNTNPNKIQLGEYEHHIWYTISPSD
ncbi:hypothetical protein BJ878DRAFT_139898 [Calycina marina]|uniref:FHA domain-containing protein n=1 Tax=Calycina marina TaxID=1763456 RepID=A0A9P7Z954_9HELO|nr:hypothetical protein BJ878DRAFT_139898 [Calycina marina]